jgi:hypothetical protein
MKFYFKIVGISVFLFFVSCTCRSREYEDFYAHLQTFQAPSHSMQEEDYFVILLVDACHLDYTNACHFFQSVAIHPNGSRRGDIGHAWIYLQGKCNGRIFVLEGGHSGEREEPPARYFDGIMNYNDWGYANPTPKQICCPRYEPNPIRYLWTKREDGFFQQGSGGHSPTFAAKISLSPQQCERILSFIRHYPYCDYGLMGPQCCTFVAQVAALAGVSLATHTMMRVAPSIYYGKTWIRLWEDPYYSQVTFSTPDVLEKSLIKAVENGEAEYALDWYFKQKSLSLIL